MDEHDINNDSKQHVKNDWKELILKSRHEKINSDERTLFVHGALREKLETNHKENKSEIEIQLQKSDLHLQALIKFGNELVNNIKYSHEHHELLRTKEKHEKEAELQENLRKEAKLSLNQFDEISRKWKDITDMKEPMGIHEEIQKQRESIENLMDSKNELIQQCEQELQKISKKYYEDQSKLSESICLLVERIGHQIRLLKKSYRSCFNDLQNTVNMEKVKILESGQEKWSNIYKHLMNKEAKRMETVKEKQTFYAQELDNIRNQQEEITRATKIRIEKDAELLETEIRKTQANILMNSEKIDYNYQVLQKRNEENIIINNHQKRRVAKLNETIVALRKKLNEVKCDNTLAMENLTVDIQKLHFSINDMHTKSEHFRKNNSLKLAKIWNINFKEIEHLVTAVLEIDRILYEQQLGRKWTVPNIDLDKLDYMRYFQASLKPKPSLLRCHKSKPLTRFTNQKYLQDILFKISDRAGFLIEDKLLEILAPYTDEQQCLVKIESIFSALNITNIEEVEDLMEYFEPYSWCKNCSSESTINSLKTLRADQKNFNAANSTKSNKLGCNNHILYMEPALVLCALNDFMSGEVKSFFKSGERREIKTKLDLDLLQVDKDHVSSYWQQFALYMPKEQQNVWKTTEHGLNHYLEVLKKRAQIDNECIFLRKQNGELKHLLQKL